MSNWTRSPSRLLRISVLDAYRKGWEDARNGIAFDYNYYNSLTDKYEQSNYEIARLLVVEARQKGVSVSTFKPIAKSAWKSVQKVVDGVSAWFYVSELPFHVLATRRKVGSVNPSTLRELQKITRVS